MFSSGDTSTSQLSTRELGRRFLVRALTDRAQLRATLPEDPLALEASAVAHIERIAHKLSGEAEAFGFEEVSAIAAAIELMAHGGAVRNVRDRLELFTRLDAQLSALEVMLEYQLAEIESQDAVGALAVGAQSAGVPKRR